MFDADLDRKTIVRRAGLAASLTHPRVIRVFDTGSEGNSFFTVSELVGDSLRTVKLPLPQDASLHIAIDIAEALSYAHERGVVHGHVHEANVLLAEGGAKLADFALAQEGGSKADDLTQFGSMLHRVATLEHRPGEVGLATVVDRLRSGTYASATQALADLKQLRPPEASRSTPSRKGLLIAVLAVSVAVAIFGLLRLGERSPSGGLIPGGSIEGTPLEIIGQTDFDPQSTDAVKAENPQTVKNAFDGNPNTFWSTESYEKSADFSGLKDGVGLILDVGDGVEVGKAQVLFVAPGCSFEIRTSADKNAPIGEWPVRHAVIESPASAALEFEPATTRFWLVWITQLTESGGTFKCSIKELDLFAP